VPDTSELSPRVASVFTAARARIIPEVARASMNEGRQMMLKGDAAGAHRQFEAVTKLLSDPGLAGRADLSDLSMAATAFSELTKAQMAQAAAAAAAAAAPAPTPQANAVTEPAASSNGGAPAAPNVAPPAASRTPAGAQPPPAPRPSTTTTSRSSNTTSTRPATPAPAPPGFVPAVPIMQALPAWAPPTGAIAQLGFSGGVRVTIDASGHVTGAVMEPSVYPPYDRLVLAAAKEWTYRPATQNGQPVASERRVEIVLKPRNN
jgi:TonB family protein